MRKSYYWGGARYTFASVGVSVPNAAEVLLRSSVGAAIVGLGGLGPYVDVHPDWDLRARSPLLHDELEGGVYAWAAWLAILAGLMTVSSRVLTRVFVTRRWASSHNKLGPRGGDPRSSRKKLGSNVFAPLALFSVAGF